MSEELIEALSRTILLARDFVPPEVSDEAIVRGLQSTKVVLSADHENLESGACQSSVVTLAQQLIATGIDVRFAGPDADLAQAQPPWRSKTIYGVLHDMAVNFIPDARVSIGGPARDEELVFAFGDTAAPGISGWRLFGSAWQGAVAPLRFASQRWRGDFPIGGLAAATMAAAEPFKAALRGMFAPDEVQAAQLSAAIDACVTLAPDGTAVPRDLGRLDMISGGAIAQAALHALLRVPGLKGDVRVFEPELLDLSNLNRYALALRTFVHRLKLESLYACSSAALRIRGVPVRFDSAVAESTTLSPAVIVGTDNIPSRALVQSRRPAWLCVGATSHFEAMVTEHEPALNSGCAGCAHPTTDGVEGTIPTVAFASYWSGLMIAGRVLRRLGGTQCDAAEQALSIFGLRVDTPYGQWRRPVPVVPECPVAFHGVAKAQERYETVL